MDARDVRDCPSCGKSIKRKAILCKHCQSQVGSDSQLNAGDSSSKQGAAFTNVGNALSALVDQEESRAHIQAPPVPTPKRYSVPWVVAAIALLVAVGSFWIHKNYSPVRHSSDAVESQQPAKSSPPASESVTIDKSFKAGELTLVIHSVERTTFLHEKPAPDGVSYILVHYDIRNDSRQPDSVDWRDRFALLTDEDPPIQYSSATDLRGDGKEFQPGFGQTGLLAVFEIPSSQCEKRFFLHLYGHTYDQRVAFCFRDANQGGQEGEHESSEKAVKIAAQYAGFKATAIPGYWYEETSDVTKPNLSFGMNSEQGNQKVLFVVFDTTAPVDKLDSFVGLPPYTDVIRLTPSDMKDAKLDENNQLLGTGNLHWFVARYARQEPPQGEDSNAVILTGAFPSKKPGKSILVIGRGLTPGKAYDYKSTLWLCDQMSSDFTASGNAERSGSENSEQFVKESSSAQRSSTSDTSSNTPDNATALIDEILQRVKSNPDSSIDELTSRIAALPKPAPGNSADATRLNKIGLTALRAKRYDEADSDFAAAAKADASDPKLLSNLGFAEMYSGNLKSAQKHLYSSIALDPSKSVGWGDVGIVSARMGKQDEAVSAFWLDTKSQMVRHWDFSSPLTPMPILPVFVRLEDWLWARSGLATQQRMERQPASMESPRNLHHPRPHKNLQHHWII